MNEIFKAFDKNNDGILNQEELIQGFVQVWTPERCKIEVDFILSKLDLNGSGAIDYSGKHYKKGNSHDCRVYACHNQYARDAQ